MKQHSYGPAALARLLADSPQGRIMAAMYNTPQYRFIAAIHNMPQYRLMSYLQNAPLGQFARLMKNSPTYRIAEIARSAAEAQARQGEALLRAVPRRPAPHIAVECQRCAERDRRRIGFRP